MKTYTLELTETELNLLKYTVSKAAAVTDGRKALGKSLEALREKLVMAPEQALCATCQEPKREGFCPFQKDHDEWDETQSRGAFDPEYGDF